MLSERLVARLSVFSVYHRLPWNDQCMFMKLSALCAGPALSLVPLIVASHGSSVPVAVVCLTSTLSLQAFCYAGFHAYVQVCAV